MPCHSFISMTTKQLWQRIQREVGTRPDGEPGSATAQAVAAKLGIDVAEPASVSSSNSAQWPRDTDAEMESFYGTRGQNITQITPPYQLFYENRALKTITVHKRISSAVLAALSEVLSVYGIERIRALKLDQFDGCLAVRKKRGGSSWSVHSYAAALDFGAEWNSLHQDHTTALYARPEYEAWWQAWERQGAVSLGRQCDFDWMHVQFVRLA